MTDSTAPLPPAPPGTFTIVALPDTQKYMAAGPHVFETMVRWVIAHRDDQRIVFVSHLGDVVLDNTPEEWEMARRIMGQLTDVVPYGISVGNKDMDCLAGDASRFSAAFPASSFTGRSWYGGQIGDNTDSFQLLEVGGRRFIILHLECNAPDRVLDWANQVLADHADRLAIVAAHMFLGPIDEPQTREESFSNRKGVMRWSKCHGPAGHSPQALWDKCFSRHANVLLILCGDQSHTQAMRLTLIGHHGNPVHVCLSDYGGAPEGWLRLYRFEPAAGRIRVFSFGPVSGTLCPGTTLVPDAGQHQFTLPWSLSARPGSVPA